MAPGSRYALGDVLEWTPGNWTRYIRYVHVRSHLFQAAMWQGLYGVLRYGCRRTLCIWQNLLRDVTHWWNLVLFEFIKMDCSERIIAGALSSNSGVVDELDLHLPLQVYRVIKMF